MSKVLKTSPRFRAVPLSLRYQGIGSSDTFSSFFSSKQNGSGRAQKVIDESLPATAPSAPSAHSGFSKGRPCLDEMISIIIYKSIYDFSMVRRWRSGIIVRYWSESSRFESAWATTSTMFFQFLQKLFVGIQVQFPDPASKLSNANRVVAHPSLRPPPPPPRISPRLTGGEMLYFSLTSFSRSVNVTQRVQQSMVWRFKNCSFVFSKQQGIVIKLPVTPRPGTAAEWGLHQALKLKKSQ